MMVANDECQIDFIFIVCVCVCACVCNLLFGAMKHKPPNIDSESRASAVPASPFSSVKQTEMTNKKPQPPSAVPAKKAQQLSISEKKKLLKKETTAAVQESIKKESKNAMDDIFASLAAPTPAAGATEALSSSSGANEKKGKAIGKKRDRESGADGRQQSNKQGKKDGLYKAPAAEDEFDMTDDMFFSRDGGKTVRRTEDGLRLMTEEDLVKATNAGSKKAGTTVNCPFDCDCCF